MASGILLGELRHSSSLQSIGHRIYGDESEDVYYDLLEDLFDHCEYLIFVCRWVEIFLNWREICRLNGTDM